EGRSALRWGRGRNCLLSGRGNRHSRVETRHVRGHLGEFPVGRRPALRWERRRHHDHPSYRTPKGISAADRDGWGALFASVADRRCALSDHLAAVVPHRRISATIELRSGAAQPSKIPQRRAKGATLRAARCGGLCGRGLQPWPPGTSSGQVPTAIKDVAKFVRQLTQRGVTYRVYEYQGVFVEGEVQHGKDLIVRTCTTSCGPRVRRDPQQIISCAMCE